MSIKHFLSTALAAAVVISLQCCGKGNSFFQIEGAVWNTMYHITYCGPEELSDSISKVLKEVELSASVFNPSSTISRVNAGATDSIDAHFKTILAKAKEIYIATSGAFDPTISPLIDAWGFGKGHQITSDTAAIDSIRQFVGMDKIEISGSRIIKADQRVQLNFSAIAKGYGCDAIAEMFRRNGVENYLVEIGGEVAAGGVSPSGGKWAIAVDIPQEEASAVSRKAQSVILISDCGVATSGNYRNYHDEGGKRIGHTINPATGRPVQTRILSATVVASDAMEADAYATAFMVMGYENTKAFSLAHKMPVFLILDDMTTWASPKFSSLLKK